MRLVCEWNKMIESIAKQNERKKWFYVIDTFYDSSIVLILLILNYHNVIHRRDLDDFFFVSFLDRHFVACMHWRDFSKSKKKLND